MNITFIGGGNMASALIGGLLKRGFAAAHIRVVEVNHDSCTRLHNEYGVRASADLAAGVAHSEFIVLAVKPQQLHEAAMQLAPMLTGQLVISIAAGIRAADLQRWLKTDNIVRAMPNTPAMVGSGATALYANSQVSRQQHNLAESIMRAVGLAVWVDNEAHMDTVTALSGSGPAYFFLVMEALERAACELGLPADTARLLTLQTAYGAAKIALESNESTAALRRRVTSPGGTTEQAIKVLQQGHTQELFSAALLAAHRRSQELAELLGKNND